MRYNGDTPTLRCRMAQAVVDPAEIRRFAGNLKRYLSQRQAELNALHGQFLSLGDTWRDQEYDRFRESFEEQLKTDERFLEVASEFLPFLMRKAERIEEYLSQR